MQQNERNVLWIVDAVGNKGKSYLSNYLAINYGYLLLDGTTKIQDFAMLFCDTFKGAVFDVARSAILFFQYEVLEALKNGYLCTGKYSGKTWRFNPFHVVVFSNHHPNYEKLSLDRWDVLVIGEDRLANVIREAIVSPEGEFPFVPPEKPPILTENFDLRGYISRLIPGYTPETENSVVIICCLNLIRIHWFNLTVYNIQLIHFCPCFLSGSCFRTG